MSNANRMHGWTVVNSHLSSMYMPQELCLRKSHVCSGEELRSLFVRCIHPSQLILHIYSDLTINGCLLHPSSSIVHSEKCCPGAPDTPNEGAYGDETTLGWELPARPSCNPKAIQIKPKNTNRTLFLVAYSQPTKEQPPPGHRPNMLLQRRSICCLALAAALAEGLLPQFSPIDAVSRVSRHRNLQNRQTIWRPSTVEPMEDDETLLGSVDESMLRGLCRQYSLEDTGSKVELLQRLRDFAARQAVKESQRRRGRTKRVEANLEGKARHTIIDQDPYEEMEEDTDEDQGYFYYAAPETEQDKQRKEEERRERLKKRVEISRAHSQITAPPPPESVKPNEKGERVVTLYSTQDQNDLTSQAQLSTDMSMDNAGYQQKTLDVTGSARANKADNDLLDQVRGDLVEVVRNLLATTGLPAFQDDYEEGDEIASNAFSYYTGFQPERIRPDDLSSSSVAIRVNNGHVLKEVLSEFELQAIGHDGMAADDIANGGGHYREVEKVRSFLEGYRKAEERRVARETATMLLDRLVKDGISGLDQLLAGMIREGDEASYTAASDGGELNSALVRYLEEAIREQEQRVEKTTLGMKDDEVPDAPSDDSDLLWNVTRSDDGTIIESLDPNNPAVGRIIRDELEKTKESAGIVEDKLVTMTVQVRIEPSVE